MSRQIDPVRLRKWGPSSRQVLCSLLIVIVLPVTINCHLADERAPRGPERWEQDIVALEARLREHPVAPGGVVFVGSSSIRLWKLNESFPGLPAVNHGFGGSETSDSVHFFERLVTPLKPSIIVLYAGDNDIARGQSPEDVRHDFREFVAKMKAELPAETQLIYVAIKPSLKRWALADTIRAANLAIQEDCVNDEQLHFLNVWDPMLTADGTPDPGIFVDDGLHLNAEGYKLWSALLQTRLDELSSPGSDTK